jgi:sulfonate transport system permease protein
VSAPATELEEEHRHPDEDESAAGADAVVLPSGGRRRRRRRAARRALGLVVPLLLLGVWAAVSALGVIAPTILPPPLRVGQALVAFVTPRDSAGLPGIVPFSGAAGVHVAASVRRALTAYALALAVGIPLGAGLGLSRLLSDLLDPIVQALRAIPIFAWLPLAIVWFGLGEGAARYLVFVGALFPIVIATADSVGRVPRSYVETARMLGTRRRALLRRVYVPAALPGIITGMRLGLTLGWMSVIVGELTGTRYGLGAMMFAARESGRLDQVIVGMIFFAVIGLTGDLLLRRLTRRAVAWSDR